MCAPGSEWFTNGSVSFELIKGFPAAFITLGLGYVALQIQKHQANVAAAKLNLDLFDRRYKVFEATWAELSSAIQTDAVRMTNPDFTNLFPSAEFLFGKEIRDYMQEVSNKITQLWTIQQRTRANQNVVPADLINDEYELSIWLGHQASVECRARFGPYLDFSKWK